MVGCGRIRKHPVAWKDVARTSIRWIVWGGYVLVVVWHISRGGASGINLLCTEVEYLYQNGDNDSYRKIYGRMLEIVEKMYNIIIQYNA